MISMKCFNKGHLKINRLQNKIKEYINELFIDFVLKIFFLKIY